ncbi:unnamed protein product [Ceratitis capitata]|uniref:(Mediterranean fruit fly) hypothetical protein n=1 Tax=Ceratitis capitata TaxID=7213 RepID=A0A811UJE8_CERCA|nr:unnamed protein product [Ceratitis capitata]
MDDKPAFAKVSKRRKSFFNYAMTTKRWHRIAPATSVGNETGEDVVLFFKVIFIAITSSTVASNYFDTQGSNLSHESPSRIEFANNAGSVVDCLA